jgi:putative membrane protein
MKEMKMKRVLSGAAVFLFLGSLCLAQGTSGQQQQGSDKNRQGSTTQQGSDKTQQGSTTQQQSDRTQQGSSNEQFSDQHFVTQATAADLAEISLGRLAAERASSPEVRQFGQRIVQDHSKTSMELLQIADRKGMRPSAQMDQTHQQALQKLASQSGRDFDQAFTKQMQSDHEAAVKLYKQASKDCRDQDLKQFASKTLPHIEEHLKMIRGMTSQCSAVSKEQRDR